VPVSRIAPHDYCLSPWINSADSVRAAHRHGADELACKPDHGSILYGDDRSALTSGDNFRCLVVFIRLL
jgi:hypothetical protein